MNNQNFENFLDFGSSKVRLGVFDKKLFKLKSICEKECLSNLNEKKLDIINSDEVVSELVKISEKKINSHLNEISIIIDTPDIELIDLSIKKNLDEKTISLEDISYITRDANKLIQSNYPDKKILHTIIDKYILDEKEFKEFPEKRFNCKELVLQFKFIFFSRKTYNEIISHFKNNHIEIKKIYCSSYIKSINYNKFFEDYDKKIFLDIGYNKSCLIIFEKKRLLHIKNIPIGGNHITKDISKIFKISENEAEKIKKSLNQTNTTFSDISSDEFLSDNNIKKNLENKFSLELLNKVIYARIEEILRLSLKDTNLLNLNKDNKSSVLIFIGEGSKILNKNSIYLENEFNHFSEINYYNETKETICESACNFERFSITNHFNYFTKNPKKKGFFEKLFYLFQ